MKFKQPMTLEQQTMAEEHLSIVHWVIRRYITVSEQVVGLGYDDLYQEGALALCFAATTYQAGAVQFNTYATAVVRNHLLDHCRRIAAQQKNLPIQSQDMPKSEDKPPTADDIFPGQDETEMWISNIYVSQLLEHGKRTYTGVAKLGIEALELKIQGYTGADIARLYHTRPNHVGAWIARAASKLREEAVAAELSGVENVIVHS